MFCSEFINCFEFYYDFFLYYDICVVVPNNFSTKTNLDWSLGLS